MLTKTNSARKIGEPDSNYVLWGKHPEYADGEWVKLTSGTVKECVRAGNDRQWSDRRWRIRVCGFGINPRD